jgi:hypothetical protein
VTTTEAVLILWAILAVVFVAYFAVAAFVARAHGLAERQRGGAAADVLIFIGALVVIAAVAGVACGSGVGLSGAQDGGYRPGVTRYHDGRDGNSGGENGNGNDQRRCHNARGDCRGSFSPGPFDRSPVEIHDNDVCISPNCSGRSDEPTTTTTGERQR